MGSASAFGEVGGLGMSSQAASKVYIRSKCTVSASFFDRLMHNKSGAEAEPRSTRVKLVKHMKGSSSSRAWPWSETGSEDARSDLREETEEISRVSRCDSC